MKILIADDDAVSRHLLQGILEPVGYDVIAVGDGKLAAEQLCHSDGPRLALIDWMMPGMDGPSVCHLVRERRTQPYVFMVLLTAKESKQDVVIGLEAGADDYLTKPYDSEELKARLRAGRRILKLEDRLVEASENMRFKATHDPLTSLFNRGVIMDLLSREFSRTNREEGSTAVLMGDVDYFKRINDTHGHAIGDEVLREIARRLLGSVRSYDLVGRYGGEEFLIVLTNCDSDRAFVRAEEIREAIAGRPMQTTVGPLAVTMSFGVLSNSSTPLCPVEDILHQVDMRLYAAKAEGRNCSRQAKANSAARTTGA